ncbi:hypothetical protein B5S28_g1342 [[Candida] boidinii]|nr:hypothetical protein B5S28_g1342 [[Candida] boidinii]OWB70791.1 hypothetical protein B5S31_g471 [[Candida] boidinii]
MNSQINNSNEKQDIEHQFRNVFNTKEQVKAAMDYSAANSSNNGQRRCSVAAVTVPVQVPSTSSASAAAAAAAAAHHAVSVSSVSPPSSPPTASASSNVTTTSHQVKTTSSSVSGPSGCPMDTTVDEHSVEMTDSPSVCIQQNEVEMVTSTSMTKNNSTDLSIAPERSDMSLFMNTNQSMRTQFQQRNRHQHTTSIGSTASLSSTTSIGSSSTSSSSSSSSSKKLRRHRKEKRSNKQITKSSLPFAKRFRSRSLPNIYLPSGYNNGGSSSRKHQEFLLNGLRNDQQQQQQQQHAIYQQQQMHQYQQQQRLLQQQRLQQQQIQQIQQIPLPPVNLQSLHEIDLHEILKNPQLRHDILFDPQLQFRPNLDGERGRRKKLLADNYWNGVKHEISQYKTTLLRGAKPEINATNSVLPTMFNTLRDILLSLLPVKDRANVEEIMDTNLLMQQLNEGCFDFVSFSNWISGIFKLHCAPMRDNWVDEMNQTFTKAQLEDGTVDSNSVVEGLRILFGILEAMKLDVANHQIRILRPALCNSAISFEREYFNGVVSRNKINTEQSLKWFKGNYEKLSTEKDFDDYKVISSSVINTLSCQSMCSDFPTTLSFDHSRLILLRADIRQIVCLQLCIILYKQMISGSKTLMKKEKELLLSNEKCSEFKTEILSLIVDENGNSKWTKNLNNICIQIVKKLSPPNTKTLDSKAIEFCFNWLLKQTQPSSTVYSLLENKIINRLIESVSTSLKTNCCDFTTMALSILTPTTVAQPQASQPTKTEDKRLQFTDAEKEEPTYEQFVSLLNRLELLIGFHWSVFGDIYSNYVNNC